MRSRSRVSRRSSTSDTSVNDDKMRVIIRIESSRRGERPSSRTFQVASTIDWPRVARGTFAARTRASSAVSPFVICIRPHSRLYGRSRSIGKSALAATSKVAAD